MRIGAWTSGPKAAATASALDSPVTRKTVCLAVASAEKVSEIRGTKGSRPASSTPTTSLRALSERRLIGKQRRAVAIGPQPEQHQIELRLTGVLELTLVGVGALLRPQLTVHPLHRRRRSGRPAGPAGPA